MNQHGGRAGPIALQILPLGARGRRTNKGAEEDMLLAARRFTRNSGERPAGKEVPPTRKVLGEFDPRPSGL
jgi:hypothetical protein